MPDRIVSRKKRWTVLGISSGTSADGVDMALVRISDSPSISARQIDFKVYPYPSGLKRELLDLSSAEIYPVDKLLRLNFLLGDFFADAALKMIKKHKTKVDLIGSHGQTIRHLPRVSKLLGKSVRATWQIGEGEMIAKKTGVVTVSDFRSADIAAGGEGAPLTPFVNYLLLGNRKGRGVLNIGGIANLTAWKKNAKAEQILGFDCGPGNMLIDRLAQMLFSRPYDSNGSLALSGLVNRKLIKVLMQHNFFNKKPPKSTGREEFGKLLAEKTVKLGRKLKMSSRDVITTASELTVQTIFDAYRSFILPKFAIEELMVSGGGINNGYFMKRLEELFKPVRIMTPGKYGFDPKGLEAVSFAVLAKLAIDQKPANLPQVTGARRKVVLGKISQP